MLTRDGATVIGEDRVAHLIAAAHPGVPSSNPMTALIEACRAMGVEKLGLVTPYVASVSEALIARLSAAGIEIKDLAIDWSDEIIEGCLVARDGAVVHSSLAADATKTEAG